MTAKLLYWIPRILTILAILFMMIFSFDSFGGNEPLQRQLLGFLMHNIPVFILAVILIIAWKRELIGGILFIAAFIAAALKFNSFGGNPASLIVIAPFLITGLLFILHYYMYETKTGQAT